jgi:hypothetical protein
MNGEGYVYVIKKMLIFLFWVFSGNSICVVEEFKRMNGTEKEYKSASNESLFWTG